MEEKKEEINYPMVDSFMSIFGFKRVREEDAIDKERDDSIPLQ